MVALVQLLVRHLLELRKGSLAVADSEYRVSGFWVDSLNHRGNKLTVAALKLGEHLSPLGFPYALTEIVL